MFLTAFFAGSRFILQYLRIYLHSHFEVKKNILRRTYEIGYPVILSFYIRPFARGGTGIGVDRISLGVVKVGWFKFFDLK